ncbi:MAG: tripartite tricarboxylate transporter substrate binding protein [Burkholderiales bacterium]
MSTRTERALLCAALAAVTSAAAAQQYPVRPVRFVLGFAPGGASDTMARAIGTQLSEGLGQPVVIDNRAGAGGNIAAEIVARSAPDGYTMLLGNNGILAVNVSLYSKLAFDPVKDFAPVVLVASQPNVLVVHPGVAAKSVKELVALAKAKPGQLNYASPGPGTTGHLAGELFKRMAGVEYTLIPFKGGGPAALAMLSGETQFTFATALSVQGHIKSGKLRALAVTTAARSVSFPELPTVAEAGVPGFDAITWHGVVVPARTPQAVIARLNREFNRLLQAPDMRAKLLTLGSEVIGGEPKRLTEYMRVEIPRWAKVIKESGAKPD